MITTNRDQKRFTIKFRGVRGGFPVPGESTVRYGGNTTCFEIRAGGHLIIIDAGTGIISLGREIMHAYRKGGDIHCILLFTHLHHDHIQGLPFFAPLSHPKCKIHFFGFKPAGDNSLEREILHLVEPPVSPLGLEKIYADYEFEHLSEGDVVELTSVGEPPCVYGLQAGVPVGDPETVQIFVHHGMHHPKDGILIYRIAYGGKSLVIATDTEGFVDGDQQLIQFCRGADLLVHDAEYDEHEYGKDNIIRQGWGHSTWRMATEVAIKAGIGKLVLFHHNSTHTDSYLDGMAQKAVSNYSDTIMAVEGLEISLF